MVTDLVLILGNSAFLVRVEGETQDVFLFCVCDTRRNAECESVRCT